MIRIFRNFFAFSPLFLLPLVAGCELFAGAQPPMARLQNAKDAIERAANAGAIAYAEESYRESERLTQTGWMEIARQNGRISLFRNYNRADSLLVAAEIAAEFGMRQAQDSLANLDKNLMREVRALEAELRTWRSALDGSLIVYNAERFWTDAELHLNSAKQLGKAKEFQEAHDSIVRGRMALGHLGEVIAERAEDEAANLKTWRKWVDDVVFRSRSEGIHAVVVDKVAHKTYLLGGGNIIHTYNCELGYNSSRPKLFAGDGATPEGVYKVSKVKTRDTKFYKALLLDYPSEADKRRFVENKKHGIIAHGAGIGKLIEIHGDGGSGNDWTDGCVALSNGDMDHIMKFVGAGTPVVIVRRYDGSLQGAK